jgi:predicted site-specific integrase-resolvase
MLKQLTDLRTISDTYDIPYSTLRQWISTGKLKAYRLADTPRLRVAEEDIERLLTPVVPKEAADTFAERVGALHVYGGKVTTQQED